MGATVVGVCGTLADGGVVLDPPDGGSTGCAVVGKSGTPHRPPPRTRNGPI